MILDINKIKEDLKSTIDYYLNHNKANINYIDGVGYSCYEINKYKDFKIDRLVDNLDRLEEKAVRALFNELYTDNIISIRIINKYTLVLLIMDRYPVLDEYKYYLYSNEPFMSCLTSDDNIVTEYREAIIDLGGYHD